MPRYDNEADSMVHLLDGLSGKIDGSIERMEALGQKAIVASADLPKDMAPHTQEEVTKHTGIMFGDEVNDLFVAVTLPEGWQKRGTDHSMHSELVDNQGRVRAGIFYKAAFYDRRADMHFCTFYSARVKYTDDGHDGAEVVTADGKTLKSFPKKGDEPSWDTRDRAALWLDEHYPDHRSVWAYWGTADAGETAEPSA